MDNTKTRRQSIFWQSMVDKYNQRNSQLEEQQCQLQHRLEAMECSIPAALFCKMNKRGLGEEADTTKFMSQLGRASVTSSCPPQTPFQPQQSTKTSLDHSSCPCSPCMAKRHRKSSSVAEFPKKSADLSVCVTGIKSSEAEIKQSSSKKEPSNSTTCSCSVKSRETIWSCSSCTNSESTNSSNTGSCSLCPWTDTTDNKSNNPSCVCGKDSSPENQDMICSCNPCANAAEAVLTTRNPSTNAESDITMANIQNEAIPNENSCACSCPCSSCMAKVPPQSDSSCICSQSARSVDTGKLSLFSLLSADLQLVGNLQNLVAQEKLGKKQIQEMQHREQAYLNTLKKTDEMWACTEENYKQCLSNGQQSGSVACAKLEKMNQQLRKQNAQLNNELKNLKLELKDCMEKVKAPLDLQLEKERHKSRQLESQLMCASKSIADKECTYMRQMSLLRNQLNGTSQSLCNINSVNEQLKKEMCMLQCRYNELQKDLIDQKRNEARSIERLEELFCLGGTKAGNQ